MPDAAEEHFAFGTDMGCELQTRIDWPIDSSTSTHVIRGRDLLSNFKEEYSSNVTLPDGKMVEPCGMGTTVAQKGSTLNTLTANEVSCVSRIVDNLLSVSKLTTKL